MLGCKFSIQRNSSLELFTPKFLDTCRVLCMYVPGGTGFPFGRTKAVRSAFLTWNLLCLLIHVWLIDARRNAVTRVDVRDVLMRRDVSNGFNHNYSVKVAQVCMQAGDGRGQPSDR